MNMRKIAGITSIILLFLAIYSYSIKSIYWYYIGVIGVWIFFDNLANSRKRKTTLDLLLQKRYFKFIKLYILLVILGILIETIGNWIFGFWSYTYLSKLVEYITLPIFYPFILMSFAESYNWVYSFNKNKTYSTILAMIIGIIIWEIPNVYSKDWIYNAPYFKAQLYGIPILVIIAWLFLIWAPLYVYKRFANYDLSK